MNFIDNNQSTSSSKMSSSSAEHEVPPLQVPSFPNSRRGSVMSEKSWTFYKGSRTNSVHSVSRAGSPTDSTSSTGLKFKSLVSKSLHVLRQATTLTSRHKRMEKERLEARRELVINVSDGIMKSLSIVDPTDSNCDISKWQPSKNPQVFKDEKSGKSFTGSGLPGGLQDEAARLQTLQGLEILDTAAEITYDTLTTLAAKLLDMPISCISLIDKDRQWFKSHFGLDATQTPRAHSFCSHAIVNPNEIFVVTDAANDERFAGNPLVTGSPAIRFYAGVPMIASNGDALGSFCVIDKKPRVLTETQKEILTLIAHQAVGEIEMRFALKTLNASNQVTESILLNILPKGIISRLKDNSRGPEEDLVIAEEFQSATILFCDIVQFTHYCREQSPAQIMSTLGHLFSMFDRLSVKHGVTKIKTIGDGYMAVSGIPEEKSDHAPRAARMATDMILAMDNFNRKRGTDFRIRIGLNSGPVIAGIIGNEKFTYDCFGDATNLASRMESTSLPGKIQLTQATHLLLRDEGFECEHRGLQQVKGIGSVSTFFLVPGSISASASITRSFN